MQLTHFTDYSLRVLIHLGSYPDQLATVGAIAEAHGISRHHLTHVVRQLSLKGYVQTMRGKGGGLRLARPPDQIGIGHVVRDMESGFEWAECFKPAGACRFFPGCALMPVLAEAGETFLTTLDRYTLADILPALR